MTPPAETSATTVRPSAVPLEVAEVAAVPAAASEPSADLVGGLNEGHLYQLFGAGPPPISLIISLKNSYFYELSPYDNFWAIFHYP
jgi:hypothetical protein